LVRHRLEVDLRCIFGLRSRRARSCRCDQKRKRENSDRLYERRSKEEEGQVCFVLAYAP
jgi:hypothetical protein